MYLQLKVCLLPLPQLYLISLPSLAVSLSDAGSDFVFMEDLVVSFPPNVDRCVTRESVVVSDCLPQCASPGRLHWKSTNILDSIKLLMRSH